MPQCRLKRPDGLGIEVCAIVCEAQRKGHSHVFLLRLLEWLKDFAGLLEAAGFNERLAKQERHSALFAFLCGQHQQMLESFPGLVLFEQERCQLIVSIGVAGIEAQGFLVERGGFVFAVAGQIVICEIVQQSWTPTQTQGLKVNCFRLGILLLAVQSGGEQGQSQGVVRMADFVP